MTFRIVDDRAEFFRGVDTAEYEDWRSRGALRAAPGGMETGKHLATTAEHAIEWRRILRTAGDDAAPRVLRISLTLTVANALYFLGPHIDGIGPAYFATYAELEEAIITEVQT